MFQPLIGTIKTYFFRDVVRFNTNVSTPYRDDKNLYSDGLVLSLLTVSTPYRDDKNESVAQQYGEDTAQFQPLIGTIKTSYITAI